MIEADDFGLDEGCWSVDGVDFVRQRRQGEVESSSGDVLLWDFGLVYIPLPLIDCIDLMVNPLE